MKHINNLILGIVSVFAILLPQFAKAYSFMVDGLCYNKNSDGTSVTLTYQNSSSPRYDNLAGDIVIPSSVNYDGKTYVVKSIGANAFQGCVGVMSVDVPNSVTSLGGYAFSGCTGLTNVTIGKSVATINSNTFSSCSNIISVFWNAKSCSDFTSCPFSASATKINSFVFGSEVETIPAYLCKGLTGIGSIDIPNSVTSIGKYAFSGCSGFSSVDVPNSVTTIDTYAFYNCSNLNNVSVGESVKSIAANAFSSCSRLTNVIIGESVTNIGSNVFSNCSNITSVVWNAKSCSDFTSSPFSACAAKINSFTFGSQVEKVPAYLCKGLTGIKSVDMPNSVTTIGKYAFGGCTGLLSIDVPDLVTSIGAYAFSGCTGLGDVTIGESVTSIGGSCFSNCSNIASVVWNAKNCNNFTSTATTRPFNGITSISSFTLGSKVETIPAYLCYNLTGITELVLPGSVTSINTYSFAECKGLTNLVLPESLTTIGANAFSGCTGLTSISIPQSVTSITSTSFDGCSGLLSVDYNAPTFNLDLSTASISSLSFGNTVQSISGKIKGNLVELTIPASVTSIGRGAFYECDADIVVIEDGYTQLDNDYAYYSAPSFYDPSYGVGATYSNTFDSSNVKFLYIGRDTKKKLLERCSSSGIYSSSSPITELVINANQSAMLTNCTTIEKITFKNTITQLPTVGFKTKVLREVYAYWVDPPTIQESFFTNEAYSNAVLHVPHGTVNTYKARMGWKNFLINDDLEGGSEADVMVTSLSLTPDNINMNVGEARQIIAMVLPEDATNNALVWSSSNDDVIAVNSNGVVVALSVGTALITAATTDGSGLTAQCQVVVDVAQDNSFYDLCLSSGNYVVGVVNEDVMVPIMLRNSNDIQSISLTIKLHENIEMVEDIESFISAGERGENFDFTATQNDDGTITIAGTASTPLEAGEGTVLNLKVKTAWQNTYTIPVTNMTVTTADGTVKQLPDSETKLVMQGTRGDMNGDGRVDLSDALYIINLATGLAE